MKKFFCRTQMVLVLVILILILGISTNVYANASNVAVGNKYKFNGSAWCVFKTFDAAEELDDNYLVRYLKNGETITVKAKKGNVLKIANNEFIYYGSTAEKYFKKVATTSKNTEVNNLKNPDVVTDKDNIIRVRYSAKDVVNNKSTKNGTDKNVCLYYAKRMMGNNKIKLNGQKTTNNLFNTIIKEINSGRPILIKARKSAQEKWRFVLIYAYNNDKNITNRSKFYIIDPLKGTYDNLKNYQVEAGTKAGKYVYITIKGEHANELKKQQLENSSTSINTNNSNTTVNNSTSTGTQSGNKYTARNKKVFTLYKQTDYNQWYWDNTIATDGCGPTSCAIIASGYGSKDSPATVVNNNGCWYGAVDPMVRYLRNKGIKDVFVETYPSNNYILQKLEEGYKIIVNVQDGYVGSQYYWGHYYTILDVQKGTSKVFVGEPYTPRNGWYDISELTSKVYVIFAK